ncbi:methylated-DNA--[protein]-cysteine S-methyltransferase [Gallibacterium trehalosifermentans]|uniref:Methylated-DNA--protein-cysteine methyltransferase n=1 Tax=Gallibacterium trehalosifermentans TaxID=516935 RepID=A0ABV6GXS7_9PAST
MQEPIFLSVMDSPVGKLQLLAQQHHLIGVLFEREHQGQHHWIICDDHPVLCQTEQALNRYFSGEPHAFHQLPLKLLGTPFQQAVWQQLLQIPFGHTATYAEIADRIGNAKAIRAVGGAVGRNPISIIVPCHRILGKQRQLTGFGGGLPAKRYLLQHEKIHFIDKGIEYVNPKHWNQLAK